MTVIFSEGFSPIRRQRFRSHFPEPPRHLHCLQTAPRERLAHQPLRLDAGDLHPSNYRHSFINLNHSKTVKPGNSLYFQAFITIVSSSENEPVSKKSSNESEQLQ